MHGGMNLGYWLPSTEFRQAAPGTVSVVGGEAGWGTMLIPVMY